MTSDTLTKELFLEIIKNATLVKNDAKPIFAVDKKYKEIEENEESINYLKNITRNQEKEITTLTMEVQELSDPQRSTKKFLETQKRKQKKRRSKDREPQAKKELSKSEDSILKEIEATLANIN